MCVVSALVSSFGGLGGRVLNIISGPCTWGPGIVIEESLAKVYRTYDDLENNSE